MRTFCSKITGQPATDTANTLSGNMDAFDRVDA